VGITAFVCPNINESIALEPNHHFRQALVRNPKDHRVAIDRSCRRLSHIEPESKLSENLVNRRGSGVPRGYIHHHDRVPQSWLSCEFPGCIRPDSGHRSVLLT
jgi:hypothetical protein